jgi:hypothetical protein
MFSRLIKKVFTETTNIADVTPVTFNATGNYNPRYGKSRQYVSGKGADGSYIAGTPNYNTVVGTANYTTVTGNANYTTVTGNANYNTVNAVAVYNTVAGTANYNTVNAVAVYNTVTGNANYNTVNAFAVYNTVTGNANYNTVNAFDVYYTATGNAVYYSTGGNANYNTVAGSPNYYTPTAVVATTNSTANYTNNSGGTIYGSYVNETSFPSNNYSTYGQGPVNAGSPYSVGYTTWYRTTTYQYYSAIAFSPGNNANYNTSNLNATTYNASTQNATTYNAATPGTIGYRYSSTAQYYRNFAKGAPYTTTNASVYQYFNAYTVSISYQALYNAPMPGGSTIPSASFYSLWGTLARNAPLPPTDAHGSNTTNPVSGTIPIQTVPGTWNSPTPIAGTYNTRTVASYNTPNAYSAFRIWYNVEYLTVYSSNAFTQLGNVSGSNNPNYPYAGANAVNYVLWYYNTNYPYWYTNNTNYPYANTNATNYPYAYTNNTNYPYANTNATNYPYAYTNTASYPYANTNATNYPYAYTNTASYPYANTNATNYPYANTNATNYPYANTNATNYPYANTNANITNTGSASSVLGITLPGGYGGPSTVVPATLVSSIPKYGTSTPVTVPTGGYVTIIFTL